MTDALRWYQRIFLITSFEFLYIDLGSECLLLLIIFSVKSGLLFLDTTEKAKYV